MADYRTVRPLADASAFVSTNPAGQGRLGSDLSIHPAGASSAAIRKRQALWSAAGEWVETNAMSVSPAPLQANDARRP